MIFEYLIVLETYMDKHTIHQDCVLAIFSSEMPL